MPERLQEQDFRKIYASWAQGAGPFECFARKTNFVSLKHYPDFTLSPVSERESRLFKAVRPVLEELGPGILTLVEAPAVKGIRLGYLLQTRMKIKPVLTFSSPLHPRGIVGGDRYVNALVGYGQKLTPIDSTGYALILDSNRFLPQVSERLLRRRFNNQYELTADDLPSIEMLEFLGYKQAVVFSSEEPREDLQAYMQYLLENRVEVEEIMVFED